MSAATSATPATATIQPKITMNSLSKSQKCWSTRIQLEHRINHKMIDASVMMPAATASDIVAGWGAQNATTIRISVMMTRITLIIIQTKQKSKPAWFSTGGVPGGGVVSVTGGVPLPGGVGVAVGG